MTPEEQAKLDALQAQVAELADTIRKGHRIDPLAAPAQPNIVQPGAGGWTPGSWVPLLVAVGGGALVSIAAALIAPAATPVTVLAAALAGIGAGAMGFFGIKSAGPRA